MKIAQIGNGFVGNALKKSFFLKGIDTIVYDKYQNIGLIQDTFNSEILFLCLPTPYKEGNGYDLSAIEENLTILSENNYKGIIVLKSTVLPGTTRSLSLKYKLQIIHNPEFLTERTALQDFNNQEHIVLGVNGVFGLNKVISFYETNYPYAEISICSSEESESMKIMCNTFYAVKVQMFNEFYLFCEANKINYDIVKDLMLKNKWINPMHTNVPGPDGKLSYGGHCFPKDTSALNEMMKKQNVSNKVLSSCIEERDSMRENKYCIELPYQERADENYFNDINNKDEWQNEVYHFASDIIQKNNFNSIIDYGCGSGFKLLKYFKDYNYLGLDLKNTINLINKENFICIEDLDFNTLRNKYDITICADVIEHVKNPDIILNNIKKINSKFVIFSTPDRGILYNNNDQLFSGPPRNISHIREWTFEEFKKYIIKNNFEVIDHFISNKKQSTQCLLAKIIK